MPFVFDRRPVYRVLEPVVNPVQKPPKNLSRWDIILPYKALPLTHLEVQAPERLFSRPVALYEDRSVEGGETRRVLLGGALWSRRGGKTRLLIPLSPPVGDRVVLEVDNGDNAPLDLGGFRAHYRTYALAFKAKPGEPVILLFGNPAVGFPRYDAALVAEDLLTAEKAEASLGPEEAPRRKFRWPLGGAGNWVFWLVLAGVTLAILAAIKRLLPAEKKPS